jgi:phosphoenolpyruvate carboxykinase (ATP)
MSAKPDLPVSPAKILWNPDVATLRRLIEKMPNARPTEYGNLNVATRVVARSKASTYIVSDRPEEHSDQTLPLAEARRMAALQDAYISQQEMLVIDGYIGNDPEFRTPARLLDIGGAIGAVALGVTFVISACRNARALYEAEPLQG